ncbi:MAG: Stealth CR1 domain-containing protein [Desulfovibrio sp.]|nr:Stealth CR1 domain-containing protein [Desulfovibrio sp.]
MLSEKLQMLSLFFRNFSLDPYPYFCCCASCGEIKTPLENRLCASLSPSFVVDAVFPSGAEKNLDWARRVMPWLRNIFVADTGLPPALAGLAEHYLVIFPDRGTDRKVRPFRILDFFTPNGLPLFYTDQADLRIYPQTREDAAAFVASGGNDRDLADWCSGQIRWACEQGRAVPRHSTRLLPKQRPNVKAIPADFFLLPHKPGSLRSYLRHKLLSAIVKWHPVFGGCGPCRNFITSLESRGFHAKQPDFPIDIVYTWVNGSDPKHEVKRAAFLPKQDGIHDDGLETARFRDNDELRYGLRALERHAPWVRNVILVTDEQAPAWLCRDHPKIRIVDHKEFIPEQFLPTFNSHVIEAWLHTIPGLAEHYIYLNDDVFLARPCRKTDFFTPNGLPLSFVDWRKRCIFGYYYTGTPHARSWFNTLRILRNKGVPTDAEFITAHGPYAQTRANAADAFAFYAKDIAAFAGNRFRTSEEICMYSHALPLWIYCKKRLVPCDERYYYVQTMRMDRVAYYQAVLNSIADGSPPLFFCVNDVGSKRRSQYWKHDLYTLLEACFPEASSFESPPASGKMPDGGSLS